jgi:DNA-binding NarL/FixJ family response regulator
MKPLRILVADDHEIVRRGLVSLLKSHAGWDVCGEARDGREAVDKAKALRPDIIILDIGMPNLNGLEATRQMLQHNRQSKVLILTITDVDEVVRAVLDAVHREDDHRSEVHCTDAVPSETTLGVVQFS